LVQTFREVCEEMKRRMDVSCFLLSAMWFH
jgi:hypothetical protein